LSKPLKIQIVERARALIADEQHWCHRHLAEGSFCEVLKESAKCQKRQRVQLTHDFDAADRLGYEALRPRYGPVAFRASYRRQNGNRSNG
jgi:hypothetical protein